MTDRAGQRLREPRLLLLRRLGECVALIEGDGAAPALVAGALARLASATEAIAREVGWPLRLAWSAEVWTVGCEPVDSTPLALGAASGLASRLRILGVDIIEVRAPLDAEDVGRLAATLAGSLPSRPLPLLISPRLTLHVAPIDEWRLATHGRGPVAYASAVALVRHLGGLDPGHWPRHRTLLRRVAHELTHVDDRVVRALLREPRRGERASDECASVDAALLTAAAGRELELPSALLHGLVCGALLFDLGARAAQVPRVGAERAGGGARAYYGSLALGVDEGAAAALVALGGSAEGGESGDGGDAAEGEDSPVVAADVAGLTALLVGCASRVVRAARTPAHQGAGRDERSPTPRSQKQVALLDVCARALGMLPVGTRVELSSGWRAIVLGGSPSPSAEWSACVRLVVDPFGQSIVPQDVDLGAASDDSEDYGTIRRVIRGAERHLGRIREQVLLESRARAEAGPAARAPQTAWPEDTRREIPVPDALIGFGPESRDDATTSGRVRWVSLDDETAPRDLQALIDAAELAEPAVPGLGAGQGAASGAGWRELVTAPEASGFGERVPTDASALLDAYVQAANLGAAPDLAAFDPGVGAGAGTPGAGEREGEGGAAGRAGADADALLDGLVGADDSAWPAVEPTKSLIEMPAVEEDGNPTHPWNHGPAPLEEQSSIVSSADPLWGESSSGDEDESFADDSLVQPSDIGRVHDLLGHYMEARRWFDQQDDEVSQLPSVASAEGRDPASTAMVSSFLRKATRGLDAGEVSALLDEVLAAANAAEAVRDAMRATQLRDLAGYVQEMAAEADVVSSAPSHAALQDDAEADDERPFSRVPSAGSLLAAPETLDPQTQPGLARLAQLAGDGAQEPAEDFEDDLDDGFEDDLEPIDAADRPTREYDEANVPRAASRGLSGPPPTKPPLPARQAPDTARVPVPTPPGGVPEHTPPPSTRQPVPGMARITRRPEPSRSQERAKVPVPAEGHPDAPREATGDLHAVGLGTSLAGTPMAAIRKPPSRRKRS